MGNRERRLAGGILVENLPDGGGFGFVDPALATLGIAGGGERFHHVIAVGVAAAGPPRLDAAPQAALRLVGEVL
ncbi:hypothetical protein [Skermanella rosea]|uniref:hypothetical protein n=1 Tax=Skermanella rosea TaxID=1817965 RepID=UPI002B1F3D15|nr:hypothetical protein [Skermanella rosea]